MGPFNYEAQPRVLIFFDHRTTTSQVAMHLDRNLPLEYRMKGIVQHYHGQMSKNYLHAVHDSFTESNGRCKTLCATSGESVGVDFPDVKIVCNAGLPDVSELIQRGGRVGRRPGERGLFVIFFESWAWDISPDEFTYGDSADPDRPRAALKENSQPHNRVSFSCVQLIRSRCIREFFANYLNDKSTTVLDYVTGLLIEGLVTRL